MNKRIECAKCAFFAKDAYQDMGAHADVCKVNPNIWDFIENDVHEPMEHCKYALDIKKALKEAREKWKRDTEEKK